MAHLPLPTRRCPKCGAHHPADAEHFRVGARGALSTWCRACDPPRVPVVTGARHIDRRVYDELFALQGGLCGCCGRPERLLDDQGEPQRLEFYAHSAGRRALICFTCDLATIGVGHDATRAAQLAVFLGTPQPVLAVAHVHLEEPAVLEVVAEPAGED